MKMEIMDNRTISIFISETELSSRGFDHRDHESNLAMINHFIDEALLFAESTHDFPALDMPSHTEVAYVPTQGMYITIALMETIEELVDESPEEKPHRTSLFFTVRDFEDLARCAAKMPERLRNSGKLYVYNDAYLLLLQETDFSIDEDFQTACSIVGEYAKCFEVTSAMADTYGKVIFAGDALQEIALRFPCS